jgi:hypothetical protein
MPAALLGSSTKLSEFWADRRDSSSAVWCSSPRSWRDVEDDWWLSHKGEEVSCFYFVRRWNWVFQLSLTLTSVGEIVSVYPIYHLWWQQAFRNPMLRVKLASLLLVLVFVDSRLQLLVIVKSGNLVVGSQFCQHRGKSLWLVARFHDLETELGLHVWILFPGI